MDNYLAILEWCLNHIWLIVGALVALCVLWYGIGCAVSSRKERRRRAGTYRLVNGKFVYERSKWR